MLGRLRAVLELRHRSSTAKYYSIVIYGDSNTWGYDPASEIRHGRGLLRIPAAERYSSLLQSQLCSLSSSGDWQITAEV